MNLNIIAIEDEKDKSNSVLTNEACEVDFPLSVEDQQIIQSMEEMLYKLEGVGLAAPQVNINKKIALIYIPESASLLREGASQYPMHTIINPSYEGIKESKTVHDFEACYSVRSVCGQVPRYDSIKVNYQDSNGEEIEKFASGFYARVLQHEIDHLNGILITDRLVPGCIQGSFVEMMKLRRQKLPEEKRKIFDQLIKDKGDAGKNS